MRPFISMVIANFKMTMRNRTALFWNLAFPLLFIVLFNFLFSGGDFNVKVGVAGQDTSPLAQQIVASMQQSDGFEVKLGDEQSERGKLGDGDRSAVVVFKPGTNGSQLDADVYWDQANPQTGGIALSAVRQFLSEVNVQSVQGPPTVAVEVQAVEGDTFDYMSFLVPGILAMSIMNSGMIGMASAFVTYRERGILRRINATPFKLSSFIGARITTQVLIIVMQAVILIGAGIIVAGVSVRGNLFNVLVMAVIGAAAFMSLGFLVAAFARNQEAADSMSNAFTFPMMFLSGVFFPVDAAPSWLQPIMRLLPLRYLADGLRAIMQNGASLPHEWINVLVLVATAAVGFLLTLRFFRWESNQT